MTSERSNNPPAGDREAEAMIARCRTKAKLYNSRDLEFLKSIGGAIRNGTLTEKQRQYLGGLADYEPLDFDAIGAAALAVLPSLCDRWLSDGRQLGREWVARNPTRHDSKPGSFRINLTSGKWADFAIADARGGDAISLTAYLHHGNDQKAAAIELKRMLNV